MQGDHHDKVIDFLETKGFRIKRKRRMSETKPKREEEQADPYNGLPLYFAKTSRASKISKELVEPGCVGVKWRSAGEIPRRYGNALSRKPAAALRHQQAVLSFDAQNPDAPYDGRRSGAIMTPQSSFSIELRCTGVHPLAVRHVAVEGRRWIISASSPDCARALTKRIRTSASTCTYDRHDFVDAGPAVEPPRLPTSGRRSIE